MPVRRLMAKPLNVLRSAAGAFDLPSILVGVVVVGILTAGVLASIFGVIPFAQNKGAQQDLDGLRTAQGVAKVKESRFKSTADLSAAGYLPATKNLASDTDPAGSCYVGVARSGSGTLFVSTSMAPSSVELLPTSDPGCVNEAQLKTLVASVGGAWPDGGGTSAASEITVPVGSKLRPGVLAYFNATQKSYENADFAIFVRDSGSGVGDDAVAMARWQDSSNADWDLLYADEADGAQYSVLSNSHDPNLVALQAANSAEWEKLRSGSGSQQAMIDTNLAWTQAMVDAAG